MLVLYANSFMWRWILNEGPAHQLRSLITLIPNSHLWFNPEEFNFQHLILALEEHCA